jgi:hypothetical protein
MTDESASRRQRVLRRIAGGYARSYWLLVYRLPTVAAELVGVGFTIVVLRNYAKDTTAISNAGFAIVAALASLSFGCARAVTEEQSRERFLFGGECLFEGAVLLIVAS